MFDNLFGFAGPLGTAAALFLMLASASGAISFVSRLGETTGPSSRRYSRGM